MGPTSAVSASAPGFIARCTRRGRARTRPGAARGLSHHVHALPEQFLCIHQQPAQSQRAGAGWQCDQQVHVAVGVGIAARHRAEDAQVADAAPACKLDQRVTMALDQGMHGAWPSAKFRAEFGIALRLCTRTPCSDRRARSFEHRLCAEPAAHCVVSMGARSKRPSNSRSWQPSKRSIYSARSAAAPAPPVAT